MCPRERNSPELSSARPVPRFCGKFISDWVIRRRRSDSTQLQELIAFHDNKSLFPRNLLLEDPTALENALGIKIARYISISQARTHVEKGQAMPSSAAQIERAAALYLKEHVVPRIRHDDDLASLWRNLGTLEKRALLRWPHWMPERRKMALPSYLKKSLTAGPVLAMRRCSYKIPRLAGWPGVLCKVRYSNQINHRFSKDSHHMNYFYSLSEYLRPRKPFFPGRRHCPAFCRSGHSGCRGSGAGWPPLRPD